MKLTKIDTKQSRVFYISCFTNQLFLTVCPHTIYSGYIELYIEYRIILYKLEEKKIAKMLSKATLCTTRGAHPSKQSWVGINAIFQLRRPRAGSKILTKCCWCGSVESLWEGNSMNLRNLMLQSARRQKKKKKGEKGELRLGVSREKVHFWVCKYFQPFEFYAHTKKPFPYF